MTPKSSEGPFAETRRSLCDEDLISGALLLDEPAESHQGKYEEKRKEERGRLFMGVEGGCVARHGGSLGKVDKKITCTAVWSLPRENDR
jgi:hypothetical protein